MFEGTFKGSYNLPFAFFPPYLLSSSIARTAPGHFCICVSHHEKIGLKHIGITGDSNLISFPYQIYSLLGFVLKGSRRVFVLFFLRSHTTVLKTYSWLCTQESLPEEHEGHMGCWRSKPGQQHVT